MPNRNYKYTSQNYPELSDIMDGQIDQIMSKQPEYLTTLDIEALCWYVGELETQLKDAQRDNALLKIKAGLSEGPF